MLAEDIAQEVFLRYRSRGTQLKDPAKLRNWLFRIAIHLLADHYRARQKTMAVVPDQSTDPDADFTSCAADCLREELQSLPETYRSLLQKAELENIAQIELARQFQLSYSGLKSRVQRGRKMLRDRLEQKYRLEADTYGNIVRCEARVGPK